MPKIIRRETRRRGFFGTIFLWLFVLFNTGMLVWLLSYWIRFAQTTPASRLTDASAAGLTIGTTVIVLCWGAGAVVLGLFALLTRGRVTVVEEHIEDK